MMCAFTIRHTFASGGLLVGEGLPMIGKLLGHTRGSDDRKVCAPCV
jgi:site-specific recombinase XerD